MRVEDTEVGAAAAVMNDARGMLVKLQKGTLAAEHQVLIRQALDLVSDAIQELLAVDTVLLELQVDNGILQSELEAVKNWQRRIAQYEMHETAAGAMVFRRRALPQHYACPRCTESSQQIQILQPMEDQWRGRYRCPACSESYPFEQR